MLLSSETWILSLRKMVPHNDCWFRTKAIIAFPMKNILTLQGVPSKLLLWVFKKTPCCSMKRIENIRSTNSLFLLKKLVIKCSNLSEAKLIGMIPVVNNSKEVKAFNMHMHGDADRMYFSLQCRSSALH